MNDAEKFPFILGSNSSYVKLFLDHLHRQMGHQGVETVISLSMERYWILGIRNAVKKIVRLCQFCANQHAKPCEPEMGLLPAGRVNKAVRLFVSVGVYFFGPLHTYMLLLDVSMKKVTA